MNYIGFIQYCKKFDKKGFSRGMVLNALITKIANRFDWNLETRYRDDGVMYVAVKDVRNMPLEYQEGEGVLTVLEPLLAKVMKRAREEVASLSALLDSAELSMK